MDVSNRWMQTGSIACQVRKYFAHRTSLVSRKMPGSGKTYLQSFGEQYHSSTQEGSSLTTAKVFDDETRNDLHAKTRVSTIKSSHIPVFFTYIRLHKQNYPYSTILGSSTLGPSTTGIRHAYTQISYTSPTQLHPQNSVKNRLTKTIGRRKTL